MKSDGSDNILILKSIAECKEIGQSTGRRNLSTYITDTYFYISEAEVRKALSELHEKGFITISKGRGGCSLTDLGRRHLERYEI